jgi:succinate-semialdehyde dehydrogenase/glutarate-semialdehyde dehydrogenase
MEAMGVQAVSSHNSLVGGSEVEGRGGRRTVVDPATGAPLGEVTLLDRAQAAEAVARAAAAFPSWSALGVSERGRILLKVRDRLLEEDREIALLIAREQGKPAPEAQLAELFPSLESLRHLALHAEDMLQPDPVESEVLLLAHRESRIQYEPYGVVLVITPWNYPFSISLIGVATALVAGNTVVLKPAPATTLVGLRIGTLFREAGLPPGVLNVVSCDDAVAGSLVRDPGVAKIVFTGSVPTGKKILAAAAENLTPVVLELGGKDAAVVCEDADLDRAAEGIVWGAFLNAGQTCASVERVYVLRPVAGAFLDKVVARTQALRVGNPTEPGVDVGPLTLERQRALVEEHVEDAVAKGAEVRTGGKRGDGPGFFYLPTVLTPVNHSMRVMKEETFGPVLPVMVVSSLDEAITWANDSPYGLTASGWTRSPQTARRLEASLAAGTVTINDCASSFGDPGAPWGGFKQSGIGRTHGLAGLKEMVQTKYVSRDFQKRPMLWWYPYAPGLGPLAHEASRAIHAPSFLGRLRGQLALVRSGRFWRRVDPLAVLRNIDKLF